MFSTINRSLIHFSWLYIVDCPYSEEKYRSGWMISIPSPPTFRIVVHSMTLSLLLRTGACVSRTKYIRDNTNGVGNQGSSLRSCNFYSPRHMRFFYGPGERSLNLDLGHTD